MDPCTQGLLGASLAVLFSTKNNAKKAILCGAIGGISPDLDILIRSENDPLMAIEYHRHFTHSLIFVPFGGFISSSFIYIFLKRNLSFRYIFLFTTLGFFTHGLIDACTSYGTNLYWPFYDLRVAWNVISVVDPIFTIILIISLSLFLLFKSANFVRFGLLFSFSYLLIGFIQKERVQNFISEISFERGHSIEKLLVKPTFGNNLLWRSIYKTENKYFIDAVFMPYFLDPKFKKGFTSEVIDKENIFPSLYSNTVQRKDILRFSYFSNDYIFIHPRYDNVIADLRYSFLPHDYNSLWGIEINTNKPNRHVIFKNFRNFNNSDYEEFWKMIRGEF